MKPRILNAGYSIDSRINYASKQHIWVDGNKCIDYSMGGGVHIFGHSPSFITKAVKKQIEAGTHYAYPNEHTDHYAQLLKNKTGYTNFVFSNSGSEAVMRAFRLARQHTGKDKIAIYEDAWHGSYDGTLCKDHPAGCEYISDKFVLLSNDTEQLFNTLDIYSEEIAMVFVEPVRGHSPQFDGHIPHINNWCGSNGVLFGFDELITGFRLDTRKLYGIRPDITTYGKIAGGGFPIGVTAWNGKLKDEEQIFMGGTFSSNPISMTAGFEAVSHIDLEVTNKIDHFAKELRDEINQSCNKLKLVGVGSFCKLISPFTHSLLKLRNNGIHIGTNRLVFPSYAHTQRDIDRTIDTFRKVDTQLV